VSDDGNDVSGQESENRGEEGGKPYRNPEDFRLRPERPRVMRLSRKVLAGLAGVASLAILGALIWALDSNRHNTQPPEELFNTANKTTADGLASLPKDYTSIPQLGPPLPGDLGRPILNAHAAVPPASGFDTTEQRIAQESEAARTSPSVRHDERAGTAGDGSGTFGHGNKRGPARISPGGPKAAARSRRPPEHAGSQACLPQWRHGSPHRQFRPAPESGVVLCRPGRNSDSGGAHHRHPIGSTMAKAVTLFPPG